MFGKKEKNADGREYGHTEASGPLEAEELKRAHDFVEGIGTQKDEGFVILIKRKTLSKDESSQSVEIDGMVKASQVNRKFMLDAIFHALHMDNKHIMDYMLARTVMGSDFDDVTHGE